MALCHLNFESMYLGGNTQVYIILPNPAPGTDPGAFYGSGRRYPVLWLLHGGSGDATDWLRKSNIELYACENDLMVVLPDVGNSCYANWDSFGHGFYAYDLLTKELMPLVRNWFPASGRREDNFIAGMSMGGEGVLKYALNDPQLFAGAAALSCAARPVPAADDGSGTRAGRIKNDRNLVANAGGMDAFLASRENILRTIGTIVDEGRQEEIPPIYSAIGTKDPNYEEYQAFEAFCKQIGFDRISFHETPGYAHEWRFWEKSLQDALAAFGFSVRSGPAA